jgi:hypothetical protein
MDVIGRGPGSKKKSGTGKNFKKKRNKSANQYRSGRF